MNSSRTRMLVEAGLMLALAQGLSYIKVFQMPQGGSITAASMVPLVIFALRWGFKSGLLAGVAYGILQLILGGEVYSVHPASILLDYVLAFGALSLAGIFHGRNSSLVKVMFGAVLAALGRFVFHLLSGVFVFGMYAPEGTNPWVYSLIYNGSYMGVEAAVTVLMVALLYVPVIKNKLERI
ncbi:MAG: energy-coupled thiamine transporter ThiT [Bacillota bacterium]